MTLRSKLEGWTAQRQQLEREVRVLVVDSNKEHRKVIDTLLFRLRIPSRAVASAKQALKLVARERYGAVLIAEELEDARGVELAVTVSEQHPHVDIVLTCDTLSQEALSRAFEIPLADVWPAPLSNRKRLSREVRRLIGRQVKHRMRKIVFDDLRGILESGQADARAAGLQQRLLAFKRATGAFNRVLVVESDDPDLALFSEHLLLTGLHVEIVSSLEAALERLAIGDMHMAIVDCCAEGDIVTILQRIRDAHHETDVLLVATNATPEEGRVALRHAAVDYIPWPPTSLARAAERTQSHLWDARRERLVDNLFAELYREVRDGVGVQGLPNFDSYRDLIGLERVVHAPRLDTNGDVPSPQNVEYLEDVLSEVMDGERLLEQMEAPLSDDRRAFTRVIHSQFLRFRLKSRIASVMAYLGDLSEGGIFVRTAELPAPGMDVAVDFHVEHDQDRHHIQCRGKVAWLAHEETDSPNGVGFGVRFVDAPAEVTTLLGDIVRYRTAGEAS